MPYALTVKSRGLRDEENGSTYTIEEEMCIVEN